jgi:hypothetical protein
MFLCQIFGTSLRIQCNALCRRYDSRTIAGTGVVITEAPLMLNETKCKSSLEVQRFQDNFVHGVVVPVDSMF